MLSKNISFTITSGLVVIFLIGNILYLFVANILIPSQANLSNLPNTGDIIAITKHPLLNMTANGKLKANTAPNKPQLPKSVPGEVIVKFKTSGTDTQKTTSVNQSFNSLPQTITNSFSVNTTKIQTNTYLVKLTTTNSVKILLPKNAVDIQTQTLITSLKQNSDVVYAEPNYLYSAQYVPVAPGYSKQWAHQTTNIEPAWDLTKGDKSIGIAIIDTGIDYTHPNLKPSMKADCTLGCPTGTGYDFVDIDTSYYLNQGFTLLEGEDYTVPDNAPSDFAGHGTHVAGIAAANDNNTGIVGTCPNCSLIPLRAGFAISYFGNTYLMMEDKDIINALYSAADNPSVNVINMSFGGTENSALLQDAINYAASKGKILVASAGNSASDMPEYPAAFSNVISVAATSQNKVDTFYTNYGAQVSLAAPGGDNTKDTMIYSTLPKTGLLGDASGYGYMQGTSMAAPYVAGEAGLILSNYQRQKLPLITGTQMKAILQSGIYGFDSGSTPTKYIGTGLVDVKKAVNTPFGLTAFINPIPEAVHGKPDITGTAANDPKYTSFKKYRISIAQGEYPATDNVVFTDNNPVQNGKLITGFDTTQYLDGEYRLKMDVYNTDNTYITAYKIFTINNYGLVLDSKSPSVYKPGVLLTINGYNYNPNSKMHLEWGIGYAPTQWNTSGITATGNPTGAIAKWDTKVLAANAQSSIYTLRMVISTNDKLNNLSVAHIQLPFDPTLKKGWPLTLSYPATGSGSPINPDSEISTGDVNNDGKEEVLVYTAANPPHLQIYNSDGMLVNEWNMQLGIDPTIKYDGYTSYYTIQRPVIADFNGDGNNEIALKYVSIITNEYDIEVFNSRGQRQARYNTNVNCRIYCGLDIITANVDTTSPGLEIIAHDLVHHQILIFSNDLKLLKTISYEPNYSLTVAGDNAYLSFGNFDNDPEMEIVVSNGYSNDYFFNKIYVINADGSNVTGWPVDSGGTGFHPVIVADINNDGKDELINQSQDVGISAYSPNGKILWTASNPAYGENFNLNLSVADVNNDGKLEIMNQYDSYITDNNGLQQINHYILINNTGIIQDAARSDLTRVVENPYNLSNNFYNPILAANVIGDNSLEMISAHGNGLEQNKFGGILAWDKHGQLIQNDSFPKITDYNARDIVITDLEKNNRPDIISSSDYNYLDFSKRIQKYTYTIYAWESPLPVAQESFPWPMSFHDNTLSNNYSVGSSVTNTDLAISSTATKVIGSTFDFKLTINNLGYATATNVIVSFVSGADKFISASGSNIKCTPIALSQKFNCTIDNLAAGASSNSVIRMAVFEPNTNYTLNVTSAILDLNQSNNNATLQLTSPTQTCEVTINGVTTQQECLDVDNTGIYKTVKGDLHTIYCVQKATPLAKDCLLIDENGVDKQWCRVITSGKTSDMRCEKDVSIDTGIYTTIGATLGNLSCTKPAFPLAMGCTSFTITPLPSGKPKPVICPNGGTATETGACPTSVPDLQ